MRKKSRALTEVAVLPLSCFSCMGPQKFRSRQQYTGKKNDENERTNKMNLLLCKTMLLPAETLPSRASSPSSANFPSLSPRALGCMLGLFLSRFTFLLFLHTFRFFQNLYYFFFCFFFFSFFCNFCSSFYVFAIHFRKNNQHVFKAAEMYKICFESIFFE